MIVKQIYSVLTFVFLLGGSLTVTAQEQLVVALQGDKDSVFVASALPKLRNFADEEGIQLVERSATEGLPAQVTTTPAILFQNAKGRSVYAGRYTDFSTLKNFVRTARFFPQKESLFTKDKVLVMKKGRAQIALSLKLTEVQGDSESLTGFDKEAFRQQVNRSLEQYMKDFRWSERVSLQRTDRIFYLDVHPYIAKGNIYLSTEIYSQFSCIDPIFSAMGEPYAGPLSDSEAVLARVAGFTAGFLEKTLNTSEKGDAYRPLSREVPQKSWAELGLALPKAVGAMAGAETMPLDKPVPTAWRFKGPLEAKLPVLQFRFMAPLDRYSGEVKRMSGTLQLNTQSKISEGYFEVDVTSLTMGQEDFDKKVLSSYLKAQRYGESYFRFLKIAPHEPLQWGERSAVAIEGDFKLKKFTRTVMTKAQLTPSVDENGAPVLIVQAEFELNITRDFNIEGPDGPEPARSTMQFSLNFLMEPFVEK